MVDFACVTLVDPRGRVLMQERDDDARKWPGRWCFPGGSPLAGEDARTCALRELAEETGVRLSADELTPLGVYESSAPDGRTVTWAAFAARTDLDQSQVECHEGKQMRFRDPDEWATMRLVPTSPRALASVRDWIAEHPPRLGGRRFAGVLLTDLRGRVLLQERDEHARIDPERWGLPGGHVDEGETFAQAAPRELAEETGLVLGEGELRFWREFAVDHRAAHGTWDRMQVFAARADLDDADVECHEGSRIVFVDLDEALGLPLTAAAAQILPAFAAASGSGTGRGEGPRGPIA